MNEATVQQYADLQSFQKIVAPFRGVITARNVDPGDLVTADSPNSTRELFHLMQTDPLRVFVNVPQIYATMWRQVKTPSLVMGRPLTKKQHGHGCAN